jgi:hypothetical protein
VIACLAPSKFQEVRCEADAAWIVSGEIGDRHGLRLLSERSHRAECSGGAGLDRLSVERQRGQGGSPMVSRRT